MKTKHTAETLKYYLGREVYVSHIRKRILIDGVFNLVSITHVYNGDGLCELANEYRCLGNLYINEFFIYPILKTTEELTAEDAQRMLLETYDMQRDRRDMTFLGNFSKIMRTNSGWEYAHTVDIGPLETNMIVSNGYGAIPNEDSPTGYVDIFGNPCVTYKQVEEGINVNEEGE